jgi:hypothetical protein
LGTATSRSQRGFLLVVPGTTGPSPESIASLMDSSSVYGFIKGASGDPAKQATIEARLALNSSASALASAGIASASASNALIG